MQRDRAVVGADLVSADLVSTDLVSTDSFGFLTRLLIEARSVLVSFERDRIEQLEGNVRRLIREGARLSPAEAARLTPHCRSLQRLLGHTVANLSIVRNLASARSTLPTYAPHFRAALRQADYPATSTRADITRSQRGNTWLR